MSAPLQKAIDCLSIQDVYLRNSSSVVAEGFEPKYQGKNTEFHLQFKHLVERAEVVELESENNPPQNFVRVYIQVGCRLLAPESDTEENQGDDFLVQIEAQYITEYLMSEALEQEAIDAFALHNASYHVWPYWREYIMNQCMRMNLPKIALPATQLAHNRHAGSDN